MRYTRRKELPLVRRRPGLQSVSMDANRRGHTTPLLFHTECVSVPFATARPRFSRRLESVFPSVGSKGIGNKCAFRVFSLFWEMSGTLGCITPKQLNRRLRAGCAGLVTRNALATVHRFHICLLYTSD